jgi:hypothetical protein
LLGLGLNTNTVYGNGAPDSPKERFWAVLRWGAEVPGAPAQRGSTRVTERDCSLWVYDKNPDYTNINAAIRRWCVIMDGLEARKTGDAAGDGWVTVCDWNGDGDDAYDDMYEAYTRASTYTIIASGN